MARALPVVLDTETTGLGRRDRTAPREDGVVQVGFAYRDPATGGVRTWRRFCDPGRHLYENGRAAGAFRHNGRTEAEVLASPPVVLVARELRDALADLQARHGPLDLRAYNVAFDRAFLEAAPWDLRTAWGPCLMEAAATLHPRGRWLGLGAACAALGFAHPGPAHDAGADAHAALLVMEALERRGVPVTA